MAKTLLILFILLLCNEVKAASFNITYQTDTTAKPIVFIPQRDSLNLQDSLRLLKLDTQSIKKKRTLKIIGGSLAVVLYLKFALSIARSQIKLLALALFAIVIFVSLALKKKVKTNSDKKEEEQTVNLADSESTNSNLQKNKT